MPRKTSRGRRKISRKSEGESVRPMPNITTPSRGAIQGPICLKISGKTKPAMPKMTTQRANVLLTNWLIFARTFIMICVGSDLFGQAAPCGEGVKKGFHGFHPERLHGPASVVIPAPRVEKGCGRRGDSNLSEGKSAVSRANCLGHRESGVFVTARKMRRTIHLGKSA